jgi:hypothetical protein
MSEPKDPNYEAWKKYGSNPYSKDFKKSHWYVPPTTEDLYDAIKALQRKVDRLDEQNKDLLSLVTDLVEEETLDLGKFNITIVADGYNDPLDFEPTTLDEIIEGCGENCQCVGEAEEFAPQIELLAEAIVWLANQSKIAGDNGWSDRKTGYDLTLDYLRRLIKTTLAK